MMFAASWITLFILRYASNSWRPFLILAFEGLLPWQLLIPFFTDSKVWCWIPLCLDNGMQVLYSTYTITVLHCKCNHVISFFRQFTVQTAILDTWLDDHAHALRMISTLECSNITFFSHNTRPIPSLCFWHFLFKKGQNWRKNEKLRPKNVLSCHSWREI